jgi:hypothetical protein
MRMGVGEIWVSSRRSKGSESVGKSRGRSTRSSRVEMVSKPQRSENQTKTKNPSHNKGSRNVFVSWR